jgi:hypothetical protein
MAEYSGARTAEILSHCRGIYARVARKLKVSKPMVSKVVNRERISPEVDAALHEELKQLKKALACYD